MGSVVRVAWAVVGDDSAERPRIIPSSTSRFFASMIPFLLEISTCCISSPANAVLFVSSIFSNPSSSARLALILSNTAPSALARDLRSALRRAAWTGGVGTGLLGSVSLSYSMSAVAVAVLAVATAFDTDICKGTSGWISVGAAGPEELENSDPPSKGFLLKERDLSSSIRG